MKNGTKEERARWSFLCALIDQLNEAEDSGSELAYAFGESVGRLLELVGFLGDDEEETDEASSTPGLGADVDEVDVPVGDGSTLPREEARGGLGGSEAPQQHVPGLVRGMEHVQDRVHGDLGGARGTGSRASTAVMSKTRRKVPRG